MTDDDDLVLIVTERFERRLSQECGQLRTEMAGELGQLRADMATEIGQLRADVATELGKVRVEMAGGFGALRAEMIERNSELMKWMLVFGVTQTVAITGIVAVLT